MKKIVVLVLMLMLCASLCACGGLSGEKASALYPDIIGNWTTDPFCEEIALTLSKDGSCTVLDNPGKWTLDEESSNETQVMLTAKTEHTTYSIQLERVPANKRNIFCSVQLVITDAKQKLTVYKDEVFTPETGVLSYEYAMHTIPEAIGEWGSFYQTEESVLTLREDGTCTLQRQPGRWCVRSDHASWPNVTILIKLDSGKQYRAELQDIVNVAGFEVGALDVFDADTGIPVYPDVIGSGDNDPTVVNRDIVPSSIELLPEIIGTWATQDEPSKPIATFREDGTCVINDGSGVWSISYDAYYRDLQQIGEVPIWELCAKFNESSYTIYFVPYENHEFDLAIYGAGITILQQTRVVKVAN